MSRVVASNVTIQTTTQSVPAPPAWFGEVTVIAHHLTRQGVLAAIAEQVHLVCRRLGHYDVIEFMAVLIGSALSGERTLEAFYERLQPWASAFMALFGRDRLPARSALSRFWAALTPEPVEALRTLFRDRSAGSPSGPRGTNRRAVGSRRHTLARPGCGWHARGRPEAAPCPRRQRCLLPIGACARGAAPGDTGRTRGEVIRTRTTALQAHSHHWLGSFGNPGNGP